MGNFEKELQTCRSRCDFCNFGICDECEEYAQSRMDAAGMDENEVDEFTLKLNEKEFKSEYKQMYVDSIRRRLEMTGYNSGELTQALCEFAENIVDAFNIYSSVFQHIADVFISFMQSEQCSSLMKSLQELAQQMQLLNSPETPNMPFYFDGDERKKKRNKKSNIYSVANCAQNKGRKTIVFNRRRNGIKMRL